ncbi:MAG: hypothetical protein ACAI43_03590 [Phycisphaerae bacterium]|nr:hypothetical protein [Tepidisphaeraceae bacterium]
MRNKLSVLVVLSLALVVAGCKSEHEKAMSNMIDKIKEITSVMKGITDQASAKAAAPKLKTLGEELKAMGEQAQKMKQPSPEEEKKLKEKYEKELTTAMTDLQKEASRVMPFAAAEIGAAMQGIR